MSLQIKKKRDRCQIPSFLKYVREQLCEDCKALGIKQTARSTASHTISSKYAAGSDALAVCQCLIHHMQSTRSTVMLMESHGIDLPALHRKYWNDFLKEKGIHIDREILTQEDFEMLCREAGFVK